MTNGTHPDKGTAPAVPRPGSCEDVAVKALARVAFEARLTGAAKARESFDGVLAGHVDALDDVSRMLRGSLRSNSATLRNQAEKTATRLDKEIEFLRTIIGVPNG